TGQFETDRDAWELLNKLPRAYIQVDPTPDPMNPGQILPLPQWRQFTPNFQEYELAKDGARRAIQAAMGISPLRTAAQRKNEKSRVALDKIEEQEAIGSFHFVEGFDRALERAGRIIDSWIPVVYDTEREMGLHKPDDSRKVVTINTEAFYQNDKGEEEHYPIGEGDHDVTISTGPSYQSQREAVGDFLDTLIANLHQLPIAPPAAAKILSMAVQMKGLGPKGDQMAEIISPTEGDQSQQLAGLQQQVQQQGQMMAEAQAKLQELVIEKQGRVIDNEYKLKLEDIRTQTELAKAEITTKAQNLQERLAFVEQFIQQQHQQAHEHA